jgi:predicted MFS family arabinose efflux permease
MQRTCTPTDSAGKREVSSLHATLAGLCAVLVGIGLARFAYTPLIPALVDAQWFTAAQAVYLGAANLAGYLAGALLGRRMAAARSAAFVLRAMMVLATITFFASSVPVSFTWFFLWRFASGLSGGVLMVLAAPTVLPHVPPARRGLAGGVIFTGVGLGIAASGTLVPMLLELGLATTWCGLGALALLLTIFAWPGWPRDTVLAASQDPVAPRSGEALWALYVEYGLNAFGLVPHMVFLAVYVAHGLGQGLDAGAHYWVLFGLGAALGPVLAGQLADRIGFARALRLAFLVQAVGVALAVVSDGALGLAISSLMVGAAVPGVVPLVLGRVHDLASPAQTRAAWSFATAAFALGQAVGAYGLSFLFARTGDDGLLFVLGSGAVFLALLIDLGFGRRRA